MTITSSRTIQYILLILLFIVIGGGMYRYFSARAAKIVPSVGTATLNDSPAAFNANGLVGHWTLDGEDTVWTSSTAGTTADSSGNGNTGTLTSMTQSGSPIMGKIGQGLAFNGSSTYIDIVPSSALNFAGNVTLSAWVYPKVSNVYQGIIVKSASPTNRQYAYFLSVNGTSQIWTAFGNSTGANRSVVPNWKVNQWNHIVVTANGTNQKIYIDGVLANTTVSALVSTSATGDVGVGREIPGSNYKFNGTIDDVRVYNRALSADEVADLYTMGAAKVNAPTNTLNMNGIVGLWSMDGSNTVWTSTTAGTTTDSSGNGYTGTLQSMTQSGSPMLGKIGQSLWFDGSNNDYISVADIATSPTSTRSWGGWVYLDSNANSNLKVVLSHYETTHGYNLFTDSSEQFSCGIGSGGTHYFGYASSLSFNTWTHLFCVYDGSIPDIKYYKNGALVNTNVTAPATMSDPAATFIIGDDDDNANRNWFGRLDDIRVYSTALTPDQVATLYNAGR